MHCLFVSGIVVKRLEEAYLGDCPASAWSVQSAVGSFDRLGTVAGARLESWGVWSYVCKGMASLLCRVTPAPVLAWDA